ncbi:Ankrd17 [Symbiodinium pilosum]|uniref:Ankrd17 protein n=1 Tax=Symbiodinium pilosum TaxID=2952 RepID=A0A812WP57_SYMPI|nr:Ankrd17 [Symbiodinium pilosum]
MLRICQMSGEELPAVSLKKVRDVSALKQELRRLHGFPLCMQQLLHNDNSLDPATKLEEPMDLQLVIVPISEMRQFYDSLDEMLDVCHTGQTEVLRQLMDTGLVERAKDTKDRRGYTPLISASDRGHVEIARMLLDIGADKKFRTNRTRRPFFWQLGGGTQRL